MTASCILYRPGKGTFEHGIECESTVCEIGHLDGLLAAGWSTNPPGYTPPEPVAPAVEEDPEDDIDDLKSGLDEQIENLQKQVELLTSLDDASKQEVQRLTIEIDGYKQREAELKAEVEELKAKIPAADASEPEDEVGDDEAVEEDPADVRQRAKDAGIEGWDTKRIATLKKALEA